MIVIVIATFDTREEAEEVMQDLDDEGIQTVGLVIDDDVAVLQ